MLDLSKYPPERHDFVLQLMRKFELAFEFPENQNKFLIPGLLAKDVPDGIDEFSEQSALRFEYHYNNILPDGIIPRFIVRSHILSGDGLRWRSGVVLHLEEAKAIVFGNSRDRKIEISVQGPPEDRRRLLAVIRSDFDRVHDSYKIRPREMVPLPGYQGETVPYQELQVFLRHREQTVKRAVGDKLLSFNVRELLEGVDVQQQAEGISTIKPARIFISYSHRDKKLRDELEVHLKLLERQKLVQAWSDRCISPGDEWKGKIDENIRLSDIVLILVSSDFIASDYCYDVELQIALGRHSKKEAIVIPIIARLCSWQTASFGKLQALPLPEKEAVDVGRGGRSARDKAWTIVEAGLRSYLTPGGLGRIRAGLPD